jgi:outer membrane lipoprotein carrier protein
LAVPSQPPPSARELAQQIQRKYQQVHDFSADFEHVYQGGVLRKKLSERGSVLIKKPGRMRWTYTTPEKKEFVSDGHKLYSYIPADRQVVVSTMPAADEASSPALFLAGRGDVARDFTPSLEQVEGLSPGEVALKLVPTKSQRDYEWIELIVDRTSLQIHRLITTDAQAGTSTFTFTNLKENVGLPDKAFTFTIPRGVDVITDESRTR